ncbi:HAMP domain-containing protein [Amycolatopsis sp. cg5]|uniref:HAMP domain-containing protein n=1 Tax=Amycolatopsis sp. cg5 TaxID=3238802 RepID=UPI0035259311
MDRSAGRTERLQEQLPEAGFPRGAGVASAAGLTLLVLVAVFCLLGLTTANPIAALFGASRPVVPPGVAAAQQRDAEAFAKTVGASATSAAHDLQLAADSRVFDDPGNSHALSTLSAAYHSWRGIALLEAASRTPIAAHGEPVQADALAGLDLGRPTVRPYTQPGGVPLMLSTVPLPGGRVLVAATALKIALPPPGGALRQHLRLVADDGTILGNVGADVATDPETRDLLGTAAHAAAASSGVLTGVAAAGPDPVAAVVAYAPVATGAGALGLSVVTATWLPADTAPARWPGLVPALALLALAIGGTVLLRRGLVSPIRRLRDDALAVASGTATGPVRRYGATEVCRIAAVLEHCRLRGDLKLAKPRGVPARLLIGLVMLSLLSWSAVVFCTLGSHSAQVPATLVTEQGLRLARSADALRSAVTGGLAELRAAARLNAGKLMVDRLADDSTFRSVYVLDPAGAVTQSAGRPPLRDGPLPGDAPAEGLHQHNTSGRLPVVYAHVRLGDGRVLVAEYDITRLTQPLRAAGARARVVDEADRTIIDTHGYLAFTPLGDAALKAATTAARAGRSSGQVADDAILAARWVASRGPATALHWIVVAEQPIGALGVADDTIRDRARAAALFTSVLAVLLGGWHELVVVRPLRRVAAAAERVATGNLTETVYPQRQDEIGTIASCVDICRQTLAVHRLEPVPERRLTGSRS